jgi:thiol-disulfide isomerase/thioredoxin
LKPEKWLKGEPVATFDPDKVYLLECWATWCGPCLAAIPHLNELHRTFKDQGLVVIGVNVMGDPEEKAAAFVARKGDRMAYRVAYDGKTGNIARDWLRAAGVPGIPHAFLVRGGSIVWHGHPAELTAEDIRRVLQGGKLATKPAAKRAGPDDEVIAYRKARLEILALLREEEVDKALDKITESEKILSATLKADPDVLRGMAFSIKGNREHSLAHYHKAITAADGDAVGLYRVAHGLLDYGSVRDPGLALQCARQAAAKDANPVVRQLLARAEHAAGNEAAATAILEQLVEEEDDETRREELRKLLDDRPLPEKGRRMTR